MFRSLVLFLLLTSGIVHGQSMYEQAQTAMDRPLRIDVQSAATTNQADQTVPVKIMLRGGNGQVVSPQVPVTAQVQVTSPSGKSATHTVTFNPGESTKQINFNVAESGVTKLSVQSANKELLGSSTYVYVAQPQSTQKVAPAKKSKGKKTKSPVSGIELQSPTDDLVRPHLSRVGYLLPMQQDEMQPAAGNPPTDNASAPLMLQISGVDSSDGIPADGKTPAHVQIFWTAPDPPTHAVQVWLTWSNGELAPNPIIILPQQRTAEALWTSKFPLSSAQLKVAATNPPHLKFRGDAAASVKFGDPILSLDFAVPPDKISVVDRLDLTAMFFDQVGNPLRTSQKKSVQFVGGSILHFDPVKSDGDFSFNTIVTPTYIGQSSLEAVSDGYHSPLRPIRVTWLSVLILCVVGGICGGLLSFVTSQGKLWIRIVTGIIVGAVASWAYVFVGLPSVSTAILHSQVSVLFVSLLAGFSGVKVLGVITKRFNLGF